MSGSSFIFLALIVLAQALGDPTRRDPAESPFIGRPMAIFQGAADDPMTMPTSVAVAPSGHVFVADGVNDRIVEFDSNGMLLNSFAAVGQERLSGPLSVKADGSGNLWIADTGHGRVLVRDPGGRLVRTINAPGPVDLTDMTLPIGEIVWLIDNDHHRLIRHDLRSGSFEDFGQIGQARGQFHHPFMATSDADGVVYVSDTINGRVQAIRDVKIVPRDFGSYGVEPGQFHRPKGVAVDAAGRLIVVDGSLGVVQYFAKDGTFLDALRDETGVVMRFKSPCGVAVDGQSLYVTEMMPGLVRKLAIETRSVKPDFAAPQGAQPQRPQPTTCTACHLEWMPHFSTNTPTALSAPPVARPSEPYVSSAASCLSCHDGAVVDSRRKVWRQHSHRTGVTPPDSMSVPRDMPLVDGKLACRTCHSAHTRGGAGQSMADAVFLRVRNHADELCIRCHTDYEGEPGSGTHPTTGFAKPIHPDLLTVGARFSFDEPSTGCLVCHTGHGSSRERLLIPMPSTEQMCVSCHAEISQAATGANHDLLHPLRAALNSVQQVRVEKLGSGLSTDGQLECLSCHKIHHPPEASKLLVKTRQDSSLCMECHSDHSDVFGSSHDLRAGSHGDHLGSKDCDVAGPCAACHGVHSLPFAPVVTKADQEGACIVCHQVDGCAESRTGQPFLHPVDIPANQLDRLSAFTGRDKSRGQADSLTCLSCHNPHSNADKSPMLRGAASENPTALCFECHMEMRPIQSSFHRAERFEHIDAKATDCRGCHAIHAPEPTWQGGLWVAPLGERFGPGNEQCTGCHSSAGGQHDINFRPHPALQLTNVVPTGDSGYMPLIDSSGNSGATGTIGCVTCHVPHGRVGGGGYSPPDLRVTPEPIVHAMKSMLRPYAAPNLCSSCHGADGLRLFLHFHSEGRAAIIR